MLKTRSRLLKEAYPVLLLISLLATWELTSRGSAPQLRSPFLHTIGLLASPPASARAPASFNASTEAR